MPSKHIGGLKTPAQQFALTVGVIYLLVGIVGFAITRSDLGTVPSGETALFIFAVNSLHNLLHLAVGAIWLVTSQVCITRENEQQFRQCGIDVGSVELEPARLGEWGELSLARPGCSRTRACVSGAQSSSSPHQAGEHSSGVLDVSVRELCELRWRCAASVGYHSHRR